MKSKKIHPEVSKYLSERSRGLNPNPTEEVRKYFQLLGKKGGTATKRVQGKQFYSKINKLRKTYGSRSS